MKLILTPNERDRLKLIRQALTYHKRKGIDVSTWEAFFFLKIIDRWMK